MNSLKPNFGFKEFLEVPKTPHWIKWQVYYLFFGLLYTIFDIFTNLESENNYRFLLKLVHLKNLFI